MFDPGLPNLGFMSENDELKYISGPITLRDYFAAKAMQSLIINGLHFEDIASLAYDYADEMLKEREKLQRKPGEFK